LFCLVICINFCGIWLKKSIHWSILKTCLLRSLFFVVLIWNRLIKNSPYQFEHKCFLWIHVHFLAGTRESSSFLVMAERALDSRFSIDSLCSVTAELAERFRVYAHNNAQYKWTSWCQNGLVTEEISSQGRRSKRMDFSENLTSARVSVDASNDSSFDLFDLEFLGTGPFAGVWFSVD